MDRLAALRGILRYRAAFVWGWLTFQLARQGFLAPRMRVVVEHIRDGVVLDRRVHFNVVTTVGKTDILDKYLKGSGYTAAWYLGLAGAGTKSAADTLASHAGWTELTPYAGNRPAITWGTTSSGSNTASQISFPITGTATVAGLFICTAASGTSGTMYNVVDFSSGSRSVVNADTLNVTPTLSAN